MITNCSLACLQYSTDFPLCIISKEFIYIQMSFFIVRNIEMVNYYRIKLFTNSIYFIHGSFTFYILCNNSQNISRCIASWSSKGRTF